MKGWLGEGVLGTRVVKIHRSLALICVGVQCCEVHGSVTKQQGAGDTQPDLLFGLPRVRFSKTV